MIMNLTKSYEFFQPEKVDGMIHIIGCGSVGSTIAENLARCGVKKITLWDFDKVEEHNICNQMFDEGDVGKLKTEAVKEHLIAINPEIKSFIKTENNGWNGKTLSGYVFLCADSMDVRRGVVEKHMNNPYIKAVFDFRTALESAQHYAADWSNREMKQNLLNSMQFTEEEAKAETPVSACGVVLGVATTVRLICGLGVNNFINFVKSGNIKKMVVIDGFNFVLDAF